MYVNLGARRAKWIHIRVPRLGPSPSKPRLRRLSAKLIVTRCPLGINLALLLEPSQGNLIFQVSLDIVNGRVAGSKLQILSRVSRVRVLVLDIKIVSAV